MSRTILEFRLHGRGGQGIVVAAAIFAEAVFYGGRYARAFSLFGAERRGAPVTAFIRAADERLMPRSRIYEPDYVVVFDPTLIDSAAAGGLKKGGTILVNAAEEQVGGVAEIIAAGTEISLYSVDATKIAWNNKLAIGSFPMVNTVMLGAMGNISGLASLEDLSASIKKRVGSKVEANIKAAAEGFESVKEVGGLVT